MMVQVKILKLSKSNMKKIIQIFSLLVPFVVMSQNYEGIPVNNAQKILSPVPKSGTTVGNPIILDPVTPFPGGTINFPGPTGNSQEVGFTEGTLSVSGGGAANYSIPIAVPPGISGTIPQVSLAYNSQGGNGLAGYGWNISGISTISRISSTKFHDGAIDPVDYDALDRFALDGQRLMLKSGTYGQNGAIYETENFSNLRITSVGTSRFGSGPNSFRINYPDGSFAIYGSSIASTSRNEWSIVYWQSSLGVEITYEYVVDSESNAVKISKIKYGSLAEELQLNEVEFVYADRVRNEEGYVGGYKTTLNKILTEIRVKGNGVGFRNYMLEYGTTSLNYQRLTKITEKSGDNTKSYNPTVFTYNNTTNSITYSPVTTAINEFSTIAVNNSKVVSGEFSGDGQMDFILYATSGQLNKNKYLVYSDIKSANGPTVWQHNSGPFEEIIPVNYLSGTAAAGYKLMPAQGWVLITRSGSVETYSVLSQTTFGITSQYSFSHSTNITDSKYFGGDFNGDGLTDIVSISASTGTLILVNTDKRNPLHVSIAGIIGGIGDEDKIMIADFDGDGKSDLFVFKNNGVKVYGLNASAQFVLITEVANDSAINMKLPIMMGDYNGDGKADFIMPRGLSYSEYRKYTSTGTSYLKTIETFDNFYYSTNNELNTFHYIPTDYNNDGKTDLLKLTVSGEYGTDGLVNLTCYLNKDGKFRYSDGEYTFATTGNQSGLDMFGIPIFTSANKKNPKTEIAVLRGNKIHYFQSTKDFSKEKLLKTVKNGNGVSESITYSPLLNTCTGALGGCLTDYKDDKLILNYPYFDIVANPAQSIATKIERNSNGETKKQLYSYFGGVTNLEGLGFLGFKSTTKTNWFNDNSQILTNLTRYDIDKRGAIREEYVIAGQVGPSIESIPNFISKTVNTIQAELLSNKVYKTKNINSITYNGIEGTSNNVTNTFDDYNNIISNTTVSGIGITGRFSQDKRSVSTFEYDNQPGASPYIIGRLNRKTLSTTHTTSSELSSEELYSYTNNLLTQVKKKGTETDYITEDNVYDIFGNITQKTISSPGTMPRITKYEYDASGRFLSKSTDVTGLIKTYLTNAANGQIISSTDTNGITSQFEYDVWGKQTASIDYLGKRKTITYNVLPLGESETITSAEDGSVNYQRFSDLGAEKIKGSINVDGNWSYVRTAYDIYGRLKSISEPYNSLSTVPTQFTTSEYDLYGRITKVTDYTGKIIEYTYSGLLTTENDGIKTSTTQKNSVGYITKKTDEGGVITYGYFPNGVLKSASYNGSITTVELDGWGRKKKLTDPSAGVYQYEYNDFGQLTKEITPKGSTTYDYDTVGQLITKKGIEDNYTGTRNYVYNSNKLISSESWTDNQGNYHNWIYTYDNFKRITSLAENSKYTNFKNTYTYDNFGRINTEKIDAGYNGQTSSKTVRYTYKNGQSWQLIDNVTGVVLTERATVNERGQMTEFRYGNGVNAINTYDAYGLPQQIWHNKNNFPIVSTIMGVNYTFNPTTGNLMNRSDMWFVREESFQYDNLDRLTQFTNNRGDQEAQLYDTRGRITSNNLGSYNYSTTNLYQQNSLEMSEEAKSYYTNRQGVYFNGMEDKNGWKILQPSVTSYDTSKVRSGSYSLKLSSGSAQTVTSSYSTRVDNSAANVYTLSGYVFNESTTSKAFMVMESATGTVTEVAFDINSTGQWSPFTIPVTVPAGIKKIGIKVTKSAGGTMWIDDVKIIRNGDESSERDLAITYNMYKAPLEIKERGVDWINIVYNGQESRSEMYYGSTASDKMLRPYRKFYSADGTVEIKHNIVDNTIEFITFIAGDGYTAPIVFKKKGAVQEYLYLHRDYQGSITAISNEAGAVVERRQFDAWGNVVLVWDGNMNELSGLTVLDRGYTGHEHLQSVGLINMNGRLYDAKLHRFLQPDNFVQLPFDTQSYNRYAYVLNNPLKYLDPSGESWWSDNWKTVVTIVAVVAVTVIVVATAGGAAPLVAFYAGAAGGFTGGFLGTALNGGSFEESLTNGLIGATIGGATGMLGGYLSTLAPAGILPGAAWGGFSSYTVGGLSNIIMGKDFNEGWIMNTALGTVGGGFLGGKTAKANGTNIWTGAPKPIPAGINHLNSQLEGLKSMPIPAEDPVIPMGGATSLDDVGINTGLPSDVLKREPATAMYKQLDPYKSAGYKSLNVLDEQHHFPNIVDNNMSNASKFTIKGGDGVYRSLYQIDGSLRGKPGVFEWIVEVGGNATHRRFIPNGKVNGIPNFR